MAVTLFSYAVVSCALRDGALAMGASESVWFESGVAFLFSASGTGPAGLVLVRVGLGGFWAPGFVPEGPA